MCVGGTGGRLHLLKGGVGLAQAQVVLDGAVKKIGILVQDGEISANIVEAQLSQIAATETDTSLLGIVKAKQKAHDRGLAGTAAHLV